MKITIITVCFNSEKTIRDTIESVVAQKYFDIEYIVVDGGSTDRTLAIVGEYSDCVSKVISEPDEGIYDAMNKGVSVSKGDIIGILNSDDFYPHSQVITEVVETFVSNSGVDIVLGGVDFVDGKQTEIVKRTYKSLFFKAWQMRFGMMPPHPGAFVKREVYEEVGLYKLGYTIAADFDFFVRALLVKKMSFYCSNSFWVRMRVGGVSTSGFNSYVISTKEMLRSFRENGLYTNSFFILTRLPIKFFRKIKLCIKQ
ncbi:MAG: glycosyltransferase [Neptuniibacter sp.]